MSQVIFHSPQNILNQHEQNRRSFTENLPSLDQHVRRQDEIMKQRTEHYRRQNRNSRLRSWEN